MNRQRLEHLIEVLDSVPRKRFSLDHWSCDTSACAVGWAAQDPKFKADGFKLARPLLDYEPHPVYQPVKGGPFTEGWEAVCEFFELTHEDAEWLFSIDCYDDFVAVKPRDVAKRIRALLEEGSHTTPQASAQGGAHGNQG